MRGDVAVIVVNANAGAHLARTLTELERQTVRPRRTIVVDNASTDGSLDGLRDRFPWVEVVELEENVGFAAANNLGVLLADNCRWIALLNPDAYADPRWLEELLDAARRRPEFSFFASRLLRADEPGELDGTGDCLHVSGLAWRRDHGAQATTVERGEEEIFSPCAAAALYRRDAFVEVGGFDESFFCYYEDSDLSFRLRLAGHRCLLVPAAVVHHVGSATTGLVSDFTVYHSYRNLIWAWTKNMPAPLVPLYLPQLLLVNALLLAAFGVRGRAGVVLRAQRDALRGLPQALESRRAVQSRRTLSARELRGVLETGLRAYVTHFTRYRTRARAL
jgi:GT2 family glycosyltransferase